MVLAVWLQTTEVQTDYLKWLTIFVGILAISILVIAAGTAFAALKVAALVVDAKKFFDETKGKTTPLIAKVTELTHTTQGIVTDLAPKIKVISANVVETSHAVRQTAVKLDVQVRDAADKAAVTFEDANHRTKMQVARVDGMVASTLNATAELGATIHEGIRTPARKIAALVTQGKHLADTLIDRAKALGIHVGATVDAKTKAGSKGPRGSKNGW